MPFEPAYMKQLDQLYSEAGQLKYLTDWFEYTQKWFDQRNWPVRSPQELGNSRIKLPAIIEGRHWSRSTWTCDLTDEARYHYFSILLGVGLKIQFPKLRKPNAKDLTEPWQLYCPFCEISTHQAGSEHCPVCDRILLFEYMED